MINLPPLLLQQQDLNPFQFIENILTSPILQVAGQLIGLLFIALWIALVYWTYTDSSRRGSMPIIWGIVAVLFPYVGTLIYLIVRPPEYELDRRERELELAVMERELRDRTLSCPNCRATVEKDYLLCPECGWELKKPCVSCERALNLEWKVCPYCGTDQRTRKRMSR